MSATSAAGRDAENRVCECLIRLGYRYMERRLAGAAKDRGDLAGMPGVVIQVKGGKGGASNRIRMAEWMDELEHQISNDRADTGVLVVKRVGKGQADEWFAIQPLHRWAAMAKDGGR